MKKLMIALFLVASTMAVQAQDKKEKGKDLVWYSNVKEAMKVSKKKKKPLLLFFTGSKGPKQRYNEHFYILVVKHSHKYKMPHFVNDNDH